MVTNLRIPRRVSAAARQRASEYLEHTADSAAEAMSSAETCVRAHPESAIGTAFVTGLLLGAVVGWFAAERHDRRWFHDLESFASKLRDRFHW